MEALFAEHSAPRRRLRRRERMNSSCDRLSEKRTSSSLTLGGYLRKAIRIALLCSISSGALAEAECSRVDDMRQRGYELSAPLSISQIETENLAVPMPAKPGDKTPKIPFGSSNSHWVALKARIQEGDTLHKMSAKQGAQGYVLVRGECVIASYVTIFVN